MAFLDLKGLVKSFGANTVVKGFDLGIDKGEFVSLLGPSGCGKTTVLRMVAGFERPSSGQIVIDGKDVTALKPNQRNIGMVFQAYALFPNMTVAGNVGFGLKIAGWDRAKAAARVEEMLRLIGLPQLGDRYPFQLSGGQQQRVALARALAPQPQVLLLDEPLSALDAKIRVSLREEIRQIQRRLGITTIFVTHDQEEALSISDRIVVMNQGIADQVGAPFEIYNRPATKFVAGFVGHLNSMSARLTNPAKGELVVGDQPVRLGRAVDGTAGSDIILTLRPEVVALGQKQGNDQSLKGRVGEVAFLGSVIRVRVDLGVEQIKLDMFNDTSVVPPKVGEDALITFAAANVMV
jgi:putative spermidine/putrescine transport system ATP-binding protein